MRQTLEESLEETLTDDAFETIELPEERGRPLTYYRLEVLVEDGLGIAKKGLDLAGSALKYALSLPAHALVGCLPKDAQQRFRKSHPWYDAKRGKAAGMLLHVPLYGIPAYLLMSSGVHHGELPTLTWWAGAAFLAVGITDAVDKPFGGGTGSLPGWIGWQAYRGAERITNGMKEYLSGMDDRARRKQGGKS